MMVKIIIIIIIAYIVEYNLKGFCCSSLTTQSLFAEC